jgi:DNA-binding beta-propeller fold protein YncE
VTEVASNVGKNPAGITYDGLHLWTSNLGDGVPGTGSITRYNIVTDVETTFNGIFNQVSGSCFDGTNLWVCDEGDQKLYRVNPANGTITETIEVGMILNRSKLLFDGSNVWVPVMDGLSVVSASTPARILASLTGNGLDGLNDAAAFDGERVMVTNASNNSVSLWKATSLTPLGTLVLGSTKTPQGICSDGLHFWITVNGPGTFDHSVLRF